MNSYQFHSILTKVQKPSQYLGNEVNAVHKDFSACSVRVALIFPDAYEIGMSHMGLRILYDVLNQQEGVVAERCFSPLPDMEKALRDVQEPLFSLESKTPLINFDIIGITLPHELSYTNILNILDLAGLPLFQKDRSDQYPIVIGGGPQAYNPEPLADFFDAFVLGDGEEVVLEIATLIKNRASKTKAELLSCFPEIEGVYVPQYFEPQYDAEGNFKKIKPFRQGYTKIKKRVVSDLNVSFYPTKLVVPNASLVHDRIGIEIQRGCARSCRFCQAGFVDRPVRQRSPETALQLCLDSVTKTGMDEISLLSLSAGDYDNIVPLAQNLNEKFKDKNISLAVPATRTETLTREMIKAVSKVRKTGFTIAPEAGSERMRRVINKGNLTKDLYQACHYAFENDYRLIKFYYMFGLPYETDDDVMGIAEETGQAYQIGRGYRPDVNINIGLSPLVPKPFTPFQWVKQESLEELQRKLSLIKKGLKHRAIRLKYHDMKSAYLEGLFSRGDRRLSRLILKAFQKGCRFDQWKEHFDFTTWQEAIQEADINPDRYLYRERKKNEVFPWDHLYAQMNKEWLWQEYQKAKEEAFTSDCSRDKCSQCGVCDFKVVKNRIYKDKNIEDRTRNIECRNEKKQFEEQYKLRVRFEKTGWAIYYSHLETMGIIKRAILRCGFPVLYSEGYHPQMKLAMGMALSLGIDSQWEYFDVTLGSNIQPDEFIDKINMMMPLGSKLLSAEYVDLREPSIYSITRAIDYQVVFQVDDLDGIEQYYKTEIEKMRSGKELIVVRKKHNKPGKEKKIFINNYLDLNRTTLSDKGVFSFSIKCDEQGSLKPTEVLMALCGIVEERLKGILIKKVGVLLQ